MLSSKKKKAECEATCIILRFNGEEKNLKDGSNGTLEVLTVSAANTSM